MTARAVVAAFDFDGTLTRGGSVWDFVVAMAGRKAAMAAAVALSPRLAGAAVLGGAAADASKQALFVRTLAGMPADQARRRGEEFGRRHAARALRPDVGARLEVHRRLGHRVVVVSASPEMYVAPAAEALGAEDTIATRLEVGTDGRLTGRYDGANCRGEQKQLRLAQWVTTHAPGAVVWAYGNGRGDRDMLRDADVAVNVGRLGRLGRLRSHARLADAVPVELDAVPDELDPDAD